MRFFKPTCALLLYRCLKGIANSIQWRQFVKPRNCLLLLTRIKPRRSNECYQRRRVCCWGAGLELLVDIFCAMNISLGNQLLRQFNRHTQRGGIVLLFLLHATYPPPHTSHNPHTTPPPQGGWDWPCMPPAGAVAPPGHRRQLANARHPEAQESLDTLDAPAVRRGSNYPPHPKHTGVAGNHS